MGGVKNDQGLIVLSIWIVLSIFIGVFVNSTNVGAQEQSLLDGASVEIKCKYLSNEDIDPFHWYGTIPVYEKGKDRLEDYVRTASKIRDVRECIVLSEQNKVTPDLRLIDWDRLGEGPKIDVCLFRIFASIGIDQVASWMRYHKIVPSKPEQQRVSYWLNAGDPRTELTLWKLSGRRNSSKDGTLIRGNILIEWTFGLLWPAYSETIPSFWDDDGKLMHVDYQASRK